MGKRAALRKLADNQASASQKNVRISPRKLGLVAALIRGKDVQNALIQLTFCKKRIANDVKDVLQAAIANAENNHSLDIDSLVVSEVRVGRAFVMRRFHARARGRGNRIEKPFSNIEIIVSQQEQE